MVFTVSDEIYKEDKKESMSNVEQRTFESIDNASSRWHLRRGSTKEFGVSTRSLSTRESDDDSKLHLFHLNLVIYTHASFMSGLADELLADLEDHSGGEEQEEQQQVQSDSNALKRKAADSDHDMSAEDDDDDHPDDVDGKRLEVGALVLEGGIKPADELDVEDVQRMELGAIEDVCKIAKLESSKRMADILKVRPPIHLDSSLTLYNAGN